MRKLLAVLALAALATACSEQTTEPASPAQESPQFGLVARNDSTVKSVFIRWTEGSYEYSVDFAEGSVDNAWTARVSYWVFDTYPCYDPYWGEWVTCYDLVKAGWGYVPSADVRGGQGTMIVSTNTSLAANPDFWHFNDAGGLVAITARQVPGTQSRFHDLGRHPCATGVCTYNVTDEMREATVSGVVAGIAIPPTAWAGIGRSSAHSMMIVRQ